MAVMTIRLPDAKHARFNEARGLAILEELDAGFARAA